MVSRPHRNAEFAIETMSQDGTIDTITDQRYDSRPWLPERRSKNMQAWQPFDRFHQLLSQFPLLIPGLHRLLQYISYPCFQSGDTDRIWRPRFITVRPCGRVNRFIGIASRAALYEWMDIEIRVNV